MKFSNCGSVPRSTQRFKHYALIFFCMFRPFLSVIIRYTELETVEFGDFKNVGERVKLFQDLTLWSWNWTFK